MSDKLCLQWNDFKENAIGSLGSLKDDNDFLDVTLACEDGKQVEAHKVILAISSPFFQNLLKINKHPHPLIYLRGVKSKDLLAIVDFLYFGEANVYQEDLDSFLAIAEELQLKGLRGKPNSNVSTKTELGAQEKENKIHNLEPTMSKSSHLTKSDFTEKFSSTDHENGTMEPWDHGTMENGTVALTSYFSGNVRELDDKCNSMMLKTLKKDNTGHPVYKCVACGKEAINNNLKKHIEANHLEGVSIPCNFCEKTFRSRDAKRQHYLIHHKSS